MKAAFGKFIFMAGLLLLPSGAWYVLQCIKTAFSQPVNWLAARTLPANQQLQKTDLKQPPLFLSARPLVPLETLLGLHLAKQKNVGDEIGPGDLTALPASIVNARERVGLRLMLKDNEVDFAFPDGFVALCVDPASNSNRKTSSITNCFPEALRVLAVHRSTAATPGNWVMLETAAADAGKLQQLAKTGQKSFLWVAKDWTIPAPPTPKRRTKAVRSRAKS